MFNDKIHNLEKPYQPCISKAFHNCLPLGLNSSTVCTRPSLNLCNSKLFRNFFSNEFLRGKKKQTIIITTYSNKGFLLSLFVKKKKNPFSFTPEKQFSFLLISKECLQFCGIMQTPISSPQGVLRNSA